MPLFIRLLVSNNLLCYIMHYFGELSRIPSKNAWVGVIMSFLCAIINFCLTVGV
jgi:hypothetical protein